MEQVEAIEQLRLLQASVREKRKGFLTNFYLDEGKHTLWIQKGVLFYEWMGDTLFFVKKSDSFWNVFYTSTTKEEFSEHLSAFQKLYGDTALMFDVVGRENQCAPMKELFEQNSFHEATSLVRMTRMTQEMDFVFDESVVKATPEDMVEVEELLHAFFDDKTEQIPFIEELQSYAQQGHVLICREQGRMAGFLIYELSAATLYLRYWFTNPDFRDKKVGSRLLRRFFEEGKSTKRQLFWVIRDNENAIKRYKHYGFDEENMLDYVMSNKSSIHKKL